MKPNLAYLKKIIADMASNSEEALSAGVIGDESGLRVRVDAIRVLQSRLGRVGQDVRTSLDALPHDQADEVTKQFATIRKAAEFISTWSKRYYQLMPFDQLIATAEGADGVIDYSLPESWDFDRDIVILSETNSAVLIDKILARGQKRVIILSDKGTNNTPRDSISYLRKEEEFIDYFFKIETLVPDKITFIGNTSSPPREWGVIKQSFALYKSNIATTDTFGKKWLEQGLLNLEGIAKSTNLGTIKPIPSDIPVIIVSPGPSLDNNIELLKIVKDRAIIVCAAQCARALSQINVVPDFIVIADPGDLSYFLDEVDTSLVECLIVGVCCNPKFYQLKFRNVINFNANADSDRWISNIFNDTLPISSAGSVTIDCFHIFKYLGANTIIMLGLDLAIKDDAQYSRHSANGESRVLVDNSNASMSFKNLSPRFEKNYTDKGYKNIEWAEPILTLPGYYGGEVITRSNYHLFHGEFVRLAEIENRQINGIKLINSTEGGCYIEGFEHISFKDCIEKYIPRKTFNIQSLVSSKCSQIDFSARERKLKTAINKFTIELNTSIALAKKLLDLIDVNDGSLYFHDIDIIEKELISSVRNLPFLSIPDRDATQSAIDLVFSASDIKTTNDAARIIYRSILKNSEIAHDIISKSYAKYLTNS